MSHFSISQSLFHPLSLSLSLSLSSLNFLAINFIIHYVHYVLLYNFIHYYFLSFFSLLFFYFVSLMIYSFILSFSPFSSSSSSSSSSSTLIVNQSNKKKKRRIRKERLSVLFLSFLFSFLRLSSQYICIYNI